MLIDGSFARCGEIEAGFVGLTCLPLALFASTCACARTLDNPFCGVVSLPLWWLVCCVVLLCSGCTAFSLSFDSLRGCGTAGHGQVVGLKRDGWRTGRRVSSQSWRLSGVIAVAFEDIWEQRKLINGAMTVRIIRKWLDFDALQEMWLTGDPVILGMPAIYALRVYGQSAHTAWIACSSLWCDSTTVRSCIIFVLTPLAQFCQWCS